MELTPAVIKELKSFLVERVVDNMSTEDLVQYVTDDLDDPAFSMYDVMKDAVEKEVRYPMEFN